MPAIHSSTVGGSDAYIVDACRAYPKMKAKVPPELRDRPSVYSVEGTDLHTAIDLCIRDGLEPATLEGQLMGETVLSQELIVDCLIPCLAALDEILGDEADEADIYLDVLVTFPGIAGSFGTLDIVIVTPTRCIFLDWKMGAGVPVFIQYEDGKINRQLLFYARAALHTMPEVFERFDTFTLAIMQPRTIGLSKVDVTRDDLIAFEHHLRAAMEEAMAGDAKPVRGDHCRFAPCKLVCPLFTGPVLDLVPLQQYLKPSYIGFGDALGRALDLADIVEDWIASVRKNAHLYLEEGGKVAGWKLVDKRATRKWNDDAEAAIALKKLGFKKDEIFPPKIATPAAAERTAKVRGKVVSPDLFHAFSSGTTLAPEADNRPSAVTMAEATKTFATALAAVEAGPRKPKLQLPKPEKGSRKNG